MKYESIKTLTLIILVMLSILLTWNLWTYQPHYETLDSGHYVEEVTLSEKQEFSTVAKPDKLLFYLKGAHYGTSNPSELDKVIKDMSKWSFFDVKKSSEKEANYKNLIQGSGKTEIIFPGEVPIELYRSIIKMTGKKMPSFNFDQIIMDMETPEKANGQVYFVSTETRQVYTSHVLPANLAEFKNNYYKKARQYPRYFAFNASDDRTIYLPENETQMVTYKYLPVTLNSEQFKKALFSDPSFVKKSSTSLVDEYTNGTSKMTVNYGTSMLLYVNPTAEDKYVDSSYSLVKRSVDFVNEHGGWTDPYRFVSKDQYQQTVTFRMYSEDGYPIFNEQGLSEITEVWGRNEINKYIRPIISLELPLTSETKTVKRPSGHEVLKFLQSKKNFKPELLEDLVLGYQMERDTKENRLILLEPAWFYRYDKTWKQITMDGLGGLKRGLE